MKNKLFHITIILLSLASCEPKHKIHKEIRNNKVKMEYEYIISDGDTVWDGFLKDYYDNGSIADSINYHNSRADGIAKFYWENGKIQTVIKYSNGIIVDQLGNWDSDGHKIDSLTLVSGNGFYKDYYPNGKLWKSIEMKDSTKSGKTVEYDENGKIISLETFAYGQKHGEAIRIEDKNIVKFTYNYGKANGYYFIYDSLNNLLGEGKLKNDISIDTSYNYYSNHRVKTRVIFKSDNYSNFDSVRLGLVKGNGILGALRQVIGTNGIILNITEFDANGKEISNKDFEDFQQQ